MPKLLPSALLAVVLLGHGCTAEQKQPYACGSAVKTEIPRFGARRLMDGTLHSAHQQKVYDDVRKALKRPNKLFGYAADTNCDGKDDYVVMAVDRIPLVFDRPRRPLYAVVVLEYRDGRLEEVFDQDLQAEPDSIELKDVTGDGKEEIVVSGKGYRRVLAKSSGAWKEISSR